MFSTNYFCNLKLNSLNLPMSSSLDKTGLSAKTIDKLHSVFARHPHIEQAILYGSRAKGTYRNGSDIDLTLKGEGAVEYRLFDVRMAGKYRVKLVYRFG